MVRLIQGRGAAAARTAVQVPGGGGGFLIEAPHGAQLQQRGKRHAQDHGLVHAQAHLLQFLQQLFRLGSVPGAGQQKQEGGFGLHEPPFRPLVSQQSLLIRAGEPVRLRQRDAGQIEVRGRFQRRKAVQLFLHGALLGRLTEQQLLQKALFRCSPPGGGGCMHQIMLQQLQQTLGQDLVLRSKGVFQLNDLQPAAVAAIVGGDHRPHHPPDGAAVRLGVRYGLQAGKVAGRKIFDHGFGLLQVVMPRRFALQDAVPTVDADGLFRLHGQGAEAAVHHQHRVAQLLPGGGQQVLQAAGEAGLLQTVQAALEPPLRLQQAVNGPDQRQGQGRIGVVGGVGVLRCARCAQKVKPVRAVHGALADENGAAFCIVPGVQHHPGTGKAGRGVGQLQRKVGAEPGTEFGGEHEGLLWSNTNKIRAIFVSRIQCTANGVNAKIETK